MTYLTSLERHAIGKGIRHGRRKGLKEGRVEGRQEGRQEGLVELLLCQIARRFGPLDAALLQRVATADVAQLSAWALNFVDARSLDEVFGD